MPGADYVELHGSTHELHGFGPLKVDKRRIIIMLIKCYAAGPTVRIPALVADLKGFNVVMFIGLPGLRHMRAKLDWSDPRKMVLDTWRRLPPHDHGRRDGQGSDHGGADGRPA